MEARIVWTSLAALLCASVVTGQSAARLVGNDAVHCIKKYMQERAKTLFEIEADMSDIPPYLDGDESITLEQCKQLTRNLIQKRSIYNHAQNPERKWDIPVEYGFASDFDQASKNKFKAAISHIEANTCIRFREVNPATVEPTEVYLYVQFGTSCVSFVGKSLPSNGNYAQSIFVNDECLDRFGDVVHILSQSLGLWHEHQREDREDYVKINLGNVKDNEATLFSTINSMFLDDQGLEYAYDSVMHFSGTTHSKNNGLTMETVDSIYQRTIGQRTGLAFKDARSLNLAYCSASCTGQGVNCLNGGYQDPNDCNKCKCRDGYTGDICGELSGAVLAECGGELSATLQGLTITSPGYYSDGQYKPFQQCTWRIKSPNNQKIQFRFENDFGLYCLENTCYHWVEVRYRDSMTELGQRFCCNERPLRTYVSTTDEMMVMFRANYSYRVSPDDTIGFKMTFNYVSNDLCESIKCQNGGTCDSDTGKCVCKPGYDGDNCQYDACQREEPCLNGGTCRPGSKYSLGYRCTCPLGFIGSSCQIDMCDPSRKACLNGATCNRVQGGFTCTCPEYFTGRRCEEEISLGCASNPCLNGGSCVDLINGDIECQCPQGYTGAFCEDRAPDCGGCDLPGGCVAEPCRRPGTTRKRCTETRTEYYYTGSWWWRRKVTRTKIVYVDCTVDDYYCCDNAVLVELDEGVKCAVIGWSSWSFCSAVRCGGGIQARYEYNVATYRSFSNKRCIRWYITDTESRQCNCIDCDRWGRSHRRGGKWKRSLMDAIAMKN